MMKPLSTNLCVCLILFCFSCSKEEVNPSRKNGEAAVVDVSELRAGEGRVNTADEVELTLEGPAIWRPVGSYSTNGTTFSTHEVILTDASGAGKVKIQFFVLDQEMDGYFGKEPETGRYEVGVEEQEGRESFAEVSIEVENPESGDFVTMEGSSGFVELQVDEDGTWTGVFEVEDLQGDTFNDEEFLLDSKGAFKQAAEE